MNFVGDVHGKIEDYLKVLSRNGAQSIQVGDMGLGFAGVALPPLSRGHRFIRGNHDSPEACRAHPNYLGEFGYLEAERIFYAGGGYSIDKHLRIADVSWWDSEELTTEQMNEASIIYTQTKPRIVVTHECPESVALLIFRSVIASNQFGGRITGSRTAQFLQYLLEVYEPELWVFGHWHNTLQRKIGSTTFICLGELNTAEFELQTEGKNGDS